MNDAAADVFAFYAKFGVRVGTTPALPDHEEFLFRWDLIRKEHNELEWAMLEKNLPGIAHESIDLIYMLVGLLIACGVDPPPVWDAVHAANLTREGPLMPNLRIPKGASYRPPDVAGLLAGRTPPVA